MASLNFNAAEVEPQQTFDALPAGRYEVIITDSEMKETKAGTGEYLMLTFEVVGDTKHTGRKLWTRLNLVNKNATAVQIAERELSAICHCVGILSPSDSEELHNAPLVVDVVQELNPSSGQMTNRIKGYSQVSAPAPKAKPAAPAGFATGKVPGATPWSARK
ncbi:Protein of unknown function DUF669 [uncultured Caudovirales phage]|uniref:DUF669 domain-containing protein n=1 Tax=uncultured Caudovirales phage TaxID=2100421 RepID=A0A6J5SKZ0_9CAUD|nr:Protein of unknown function DUF669 [uncultured Caudovirales phage]CAB5229326.1 Protein of unknown function DUF669 [uncultured Caudovirales phage]